MIAMTHTFPQTGVPGYPVVVVTPEREGAVIVTGAPNGPAACRYAEQAGYHTWGSVQLGSARYRVIIREV